MEESIKQYESQLKQVKDALASSNDSQEIQSLQSLKADLEELIALTRQTGTRDPDDNESNSNSAHSQGNSNSMDDQMALFMSEIRSLEPSSESALLHPDDDEKLDKKLQTIKDELQAMVGQKCSAPHEHTWGGRSYHNAIVCALDDTRDYDLGDIKDFRLRIMFTNPTHKEMIPCSYFLDGSCRFDEEKCRFSHGELIPFGELRDYREPQFDKLARNCIVLAKMNDKMWHKGRVLCANFVEKICRVKLEDKKRDEDFNFEDLLPIISEGNDSGSDSSESDESDSVGEGNDITELRNAYLIEKALLTPASNQALGEWEKHTKGIGSKLMQKMGYINGNGLGSKGNGIIVPISAQILPPGRSLDHCMELREAANGDKDLFSVERKLDVQKKKQEAINAKVYQREKNKTDIFAFLNDSIFSASASTDSKSKTATTQSNERHQYKNHTTKNLNVESLKIAEDIRRKEREIQRLKESMRRHASGSDVYNKMNAQLSVKNQELSGLRRSESNVEREQQMRRNDKMTIF